MNKAQSLPPHIRQIICDKATEKACSGKYNDFDEEGTYLCRQCGLALFHSNNKFHSGCGWPSFDNELDHHVAYITDADGLRTEIVCMRCHGHLGHVFLGEGFTVENKRHCVNSLSLDFIFNTKVLETEEAILAGGCFWGVEYLFNQLPGVLKTEVGYCGGQKPYPTYEEICTGETGYKESIRIIFDPSVLDYEAVLRHFFQIHDPTQINGQGPDLGNQYSSCIFYFDNEQKIIAEKLKKELQDNGYQIVTEIKPVEIFWAAEDYHQDYYKKHSQTPYCHYFTKRFP